VMSLDGSHMAIQVKRLAMANRAHTRWQNMSPLIGDFDDREKVEKRVTFT